MFEQGQPQLTQDIKNLGFIDFNQLSVGAPLPTYYKLSDLHQKIVLLLVDVSVNCKNHYTIKEIVIPVGQPITQTALLYFLGENLGKFYEIEGYLPEPEFKAKCINHFKGI